MIFFVCFLLFFYLIKARAIWKSCLGARCLCFNTSITVAHEEHVISAIGEVDTQNTALNLHVGYKSHSTNSEVLTDLL